MISKYKLGKLYWGCPYDEQEEVIEQLERLRDHPQVTDTREKEFVDQMLIKANGHYFEMSDKQAKWLDMILVRCSIDPLLN